MEAKGHYGIGFESFEKILKKLLTINSEIYGSNELKIQKGFDQMGLSDGSYKNKMSLLRKPFYYALPVPALHPQKKGKKMKTFKIRPPNASKNKEVFERLYKLKEARKNQHLNVSGSSNYVSKTTALPRKRKNLTHMNSPARVDRSSYVVLERARHLQNEKKKFTWESLEKMNLNELRGLTNTNFQPEKFIGEGSAEDQIYMDEFNPNRFLAPGPVKKSRKNKLKNYGEVKSPKVHSKYRRDRADTQIPGRASSKYKSQNNSLHRAAEIQRDQRQRGQEALGMFYVQGNSASRYKGNNKRY